jgi:hypothetical protein
VLNTKSFLVFFLIYNTATHLIAKTCFRHILFPTIDTNLLLLLTWMPSSVMLTDWDQGSGWRMSFTLWHGRTGGNLSWGERLSARVDGNGHPGAVVVLESICTRLAQNKSSASRFLCTCFDWLRALICYPYVVPLLSFFLVAANRKMSCAMTE